MHLRNEKKNNTASSVHFLIDEGKRANLQCIMLNLRHAEAFHSDPPVMAVCSSGCKTTPALGRGLH